MSLDQLRRVLRNPLQVSVETSQEIADSVTNAGRRRLHLNPKIPRPYHGIPAHQLIQIRSIDLLRKIGELTTPSSVNLARLSASWATRRYFWAVDDPLHQRRPHRFRLSRDARHMERHQKTLLSDEFGMGFAGLLMERPLGTSYFIDMEFALANPHRYFDVRQVGPRQPDFLFWGPGAPVFIVECKGSQTKWSGVVQQLRRGMEQLPSVRIPGTPSEELVVATFLDQRHTRVIVLDPPGEEDKRGDANTRRERPAESIPEKIGEREWRVSDPRAFREKLEIGNDLTLLRWIAQHATARKYEAMLDVEPTGAHQLPDATLETAVTDQGEFLGVSVPLAPELGMSGPNLFRGLQREILERLRDGAGVRDGAKSGQGPRTDDPRISVGVAGTCLIIQDLEL